jgi:hypothetical protein
MIKIVLVWSNDILRCTAGALILFLASVGPSVANVTITSGSLNGTVFQSAQFYKKGDDFSSRFSPISGPLVHASNPVIENSIVFLEQQPAPFFYTKVFELQAQGIIGIVYASPATVPGQYFCIYNGEDMSRVKVPITEVSREDTADLLDLLLGGESVQVTISSEGNPWMTAIYSVAVLVVFRIILTAIGFALFCWAFYKLVWFVQIQGFVFNVPQVCLALEIIANLWRILYTAVDPMSCHFVFVYTVGSFIDTISLPYGVATFVLISFYWHEMLGSTVKINPFLRKLLIPFFVITLLLIAADLIISILTSYYTQISSTVVLPIIYVTVSIGFLVFYIVTARRIVIQLRSTEVLKADAATPRVRAINELNKRMILNAVSRGVTIITAVLFLIPALTRYPEPQVP